MAETLAEGQDRVLELMASGAPLAAALEAVVTLIEGQMPATAATVMLVDGDQLRLVARTDRLPAAVAAAIETLPIADGTSACGAAAIRRREVIVADLASDPLTAGFRDLVADTGLRSCWSLPVLARDGPVLATFALYFSQEREPDAVDRGLLTAAGRLTRIALERDRAERVRARDQADLATMNRALQMLSQCNEALALEEAEAPLLHRICAIAVERGGYRMAWVGQVVEVTGDIVPAAFAGHEDGYLTEIRLSARPDDPTSAGPVATALRTGRVVVCSDIATAHAFYWRDAARRRGYRSVICLPLHHHGKVLGILALYSEEVAEVGGDELRLLQELASNLALGIAAIRTRSDRQRSQDEILRLNAELEQRVQERTAQLAAANREMEAFSYSLAHDLRAPLAAIDGFAQALQESLGDRLGDRERHYVDRMRGGAQRMAQMIDALLTLARLSRQPLQWGRVDITALAHAELEALAEAEPQRQVVVDVQDGMVVNGDPRLISLLVQNLTANAWKFTSRREDACIDVGAHDNLEGQRIFHVRDNGVGFNMAHATRLFGAFQRVHTETEFPGTGLGLANCQRIVERHGGRIWAHAAPGAGATFFFTLGKPPKEQRG